MKGKRMMNYRKKTIEELMKTYAHEIGRISKEDAAITKEFVRNEMFERMKSAIRQLDEGCSPESVYKQFIGG